MGRLWPRVDANSALNIVGWSCAPVDVALSLGSRWMTMLQRIASLEHSAARYAASHELFNYWHARNQPRTQSDALVHEGRNTMRVA
jgi:hypothetical protein